MTNGWFLGNKWFYFRRCSGLIGGWCYFNLQGDWQNNELFKPTMNWITLISVVFQFPAYEVLFLPWHVQQRSPFSAGGSWSWCDPTKNRSDCTHTIHNFDDTLLCTVVTGGRWTIFTNIYILFQMYTSNLYQDQKFIIIIKLGIKLSIVEYGMSSFECELPVSFRMMV